MKLRQILRLHEKSNINHLLKRYESFIKNNHVGIYGKLSTSELYNYIDFRTDIELIEDEWNLYDEITDKIKSTGLFKIYSNYVSAMVRRRSGFEAGFNTFYYHIANGNNYLFKCKNS